MWKLGIKYCVYLPQWILSVPKNPSQLAKSYPLGRASPVLKRDYSMESAHGRLLFTSCDASKKRTSERSERVSFFDASQRVNKIRSNTFHGIICFYFIHTEISRLLGQATTVVTKGAASASHQLHHLKYQLDQFKQQLYTFCLKAVAMADALTVSPLNIS